VQPAAAATTLSDASAVAQPQDKQPPAAPPRTPPERPTPPKPRTNAAPPTAQAGATQEQPPKPPKPTAKPPQKPDPRVRAGNAAAKPGTPTPSPTGPQPLWACGEPKCVIEPVWRGEKAEFVFTIGNEGEGNLHFKLKCG
jgi:hypothetical protein